MMWKTHCRKIVKSLYLIYLCACYRFWLRFDKRRFRSLTVESFPACVPDAGTA